MEEAPKVSDAAAHREPEPEPSQEVGEPAAQPVKMAENVPPAGATANGDVPAGVPFYEKSRQHLKELLQKRRVLERQLAAHEEAIFQKETDYLENTPTGNIITGFDSYIKGTTGAAAQRRKTGLTEVNRVFSRSSISYNASANGAGDGAGTPGSTTPASHAPTPVSAGFHNKDKDHSATPTSATASKAGGGGAATKKKKSAAAAVAAAAHGGAEDSEGDGKESKKVRASFGAVKK